jgi:Zn-dependent M28 family amino/carboxypeptidase
VAAILAVCVAIAPAATSAGDHKPPGGSDGAKLRKALTVKGMLRHEQALQRISEENGGTRVSGTSGYDASVDYVVSQLTKAGYKPVVQPFEFAFFQELTPPTFEQVSPNPTTYVDQEDFATMDYSGSGNVTAAVQEVNDNQFPPGPTPSSSNAGCEPEDFTGFTPGNVALIQRGTCGFIDKAVNAEAAGASAAIVFNEGQPGRTDTLFGTLGGPGVTIPVIGISFALGEEFHTLGNVTVHITTDTISEIRETANVLADTRSGNPNRVVVQGSHLDSVPAGPGINDNGSGSSYNLESAIQVAKQHIKPKNKIRFAFWGAEEEGLVGSQFYVDSLSDEDFAKILLNLNHDMIASPNYVRFVYDGDGSDTGTAGSPGSAEIEQVFNDYFDSQKLAHEATAFDGRSDYGPFIDRGAPAGGLFSGAEGVKTLEQADIFGGVVGEAYDRCYHQACDTMSNLNLLSFDELGDAAVTALAVFANWKGPIAAPATTLRAAGAARQSDYAGSRLRQ